MMTAKDVRLEINKQAREDAHLVLRFHTRMLCNVVVRGKRYQFGNLLGDNFIHGLEMILTFALHGI